MGATRLSPTANADGGFTLTELLVVLALIGLFTMAAPALISAARPAVTAKTAAQALAGELRAARQAAVASGREQRVALYRDSAGYGVRTEDRAYALAAGVTIEIVAPADASATDAVTIRFFPDGSASGGRIHVRFDRSNHWISVHWLSGKVTVDEP